MVLECILVGHIASLLMLLCLLRKPSPVEDATLPDESTKWNVGMLLFLIPTIHLTFACWGTLGIYDGLFYLPAVLAGLLLLLSGSTGVGAGGVQRLVVHAFSRALVPAAPGHGLMAAAEEVKPTRSVIAAIVLSVAMLIPTAVAFLFLLQPALHSFHITNAFHISAMMQEPVTLVVKGMPLVLLLAVLLWSGHWLTAATMAWQVLMLTQTREMRTWHALFAWPLVAVGAQEKKGAAIAVGVTLLVVLVEGWAAFGTEPLGGQFIASFFGVLNPAIRTVVK